MSPTPLVLIDRTPLPGPAPARLLPALLQLLAAGGTATEYHQARRYHLRLTDASGRSVWVTPGWRYAWEQARRWGYLSRLGWAGSEARYTLSTAGREALAAL